MTRLLLAARAQSGNKLILVFQRKTLNTAIQLFIDLADLDLADYLYTIYYLWTRGRYCIKSLLEVNKREVGVASFGADDWLVF